MGALEAALAPILDRRTGQDHPPLFWRHHGQLASRAGVERTVRECMDNFALAGVDPAGKVILDAGCGFGISCVLLALMGAREVHGIDVVESKVETFRRIASRLPHLTSLYPKLADVRETGYDPARFDLVLSNEAISHYHEIESFIEEAWRILKPGGMLFISDGNNGANSGAVRDTQEIWTRFENGPAGPIPKTGHIVEIPYREQRIRAARAASPDLSGDEVDTLAANTYGFVAAEVEEAALAYRRTGVLPASRFAPGVPPRSPASGQYIERLIYPGVLARQLRAAGFTARVYAYLGGAGGNPFLRAANKLVLSLSPLTWPIGRALKAVARKPPGPGPAA